MKNFSTFIFSFFLSSIFLPLFAQGLIVNEGGNGQAGNRDYFELLVIGSTTQPIGTVDLTGWIVDDNNGDFGGGGSGKGIAQGHIRLKASCFSNIPIGAMIIIYNVDDPEPLLPADDPTDANGDLVYVFPHTSTCFERCASVPSTSSSNYNSSSCAYTTFSATQWSGTMALGSSADAFQTRKPDGTFFQGFSYGFSSTSILPVYPAELGGGTGLNIGGAAGSISINYNCGALSDPASYNRVAAATATPGAPNSPENAMLIENIRQGTFDYSNWANPQNCEPPLLPLSLLSFEAKPYSLLQNNLTWDLTQVDPMSFVYIERSVDGLQFETVEVLALEATMEDRQYNYIDNTPYYTTYYRLKFVEPNAPNSYSATKVVMHQRAKISSNFNLFPNPAHQALNILLEKDYDMPLNYEIVDNLGRIMQSGELSAYTIQHTLALTTLPSGVYYLRIAAIDNMITTKAFIKY